MTDGSGHSYYGGFMTALIIKIIAALIIISVISMIIDNRRFVVRTYRLRSRRIRRPVKLVFIADLHEKCYGKDNVRLVEKIREQDPDAIIVGGDLVIYRKVNGLYKKAAKSGQEITDPGTEWMKNSLSLMKKLTPICPVWFVQGNHELRLDYYEELNCFNDRFIDEMEKAGVRMLRNGSTDPSRNGDSGIVLQGLELPLKYYKKLRRTELSQEEIRSLIGEPDRSAYTVLASHIPEYFPAYARWGSDLCLCGHVHGGLMRLPVIGGVVGPKPSLFPRYSGGQYFYRAQTGEEKHLSSMILTCGLGMHFLPIRIFNPGEVSVAELLPADQKQEESDGTRQDNSGD